MSLKEKELYEFGGFRLDVAEHSLAHPSGKHVPLSEKAFATLCVLVRNGGHLVRKEDLLNQVWEDSFVEENNLEKSIYAVRRALGEKPGEQKFIETVRKHGYRLVVKVCRVEAEVLPTQQKNQTPPPAKQIPLTEFPQLNKQTENGKASEVLPATNGDAEGQTAKTQHGFWQQIKYRKLLVVFTVFAALLAGAILFYQYGNLNQSPSAQDLYLQGRYYANRQNKDDNETAIKVLERAVAADPTFAPAHAELAQAYVWKLFLFAPDDKQLAEKAFVATEKALALDPNSAVAHLARGRLLWTPANHFPHEKAIREYKRALALNPQLDEARNQLALVYCHIGAFDEAIEESRIAMTTNPNNNLAQFRIAETLFWQGKTEQALSVLRTIPKEVNPVLVENQIILALFSLGRKDEASAALEQFLKDYPDDNRGLLTSLQAMLAASAGQEDIAEEKIELAVKRGKGFGHFHHTAYQIACAYALMNKPEQAVKWLERAAEDGFPCYPLFERDANLNPIRQNREFQAFLSAQKQQWEYYKTLPQL